MQQRDRALRTPVASPSLTRGEVVVRCAQSPDEGVLFESVGRVVDELYPDGRIKLMAKLWLNTSLGDGSFVACVGNDIVGYAAETQKGAGRIKLSTFWIREDVRRRGIGRELIEFLVQRWDRAAVDDVYVTVRRGRDQELLSLLSQYGFSFAAMVPDRYGPGRDEVVLRWTPDSRLGSRRQAAGALNG